jgi:large subunit ribosomal protein L17
MRHQRAGKKLGRDPAHRKALYANLAGALIEHGRIKTTITKAKAVRPIAEQMITLGRRGDLHARRQAVAFLRSKDVVHKLFTEVGPSFAARPGGYTRITRIGPRQGDASEMAYLELVDTPLVFKTKRGAGATTAEARTPATAEVEQAELEQPELEEPELEEAESEDGESTAEAEPTAEDDTAVASEAEPEPAAASETVEAEAAAEATPAEAEAPPSTEDPA